MNNEKLNSNDNNFLDKQVIIIQNYVRIWRNNIKK